MKQNEPALMSALQLHRYLIHVYVPTPLTVFLPNHAVLHASLPISIQAIQ